MDASTIIESLTGTFPEAISRAEVESPVRIKAYVDQEKAKEVCQYLKDSLQFDHLSAQSVEWTI